MAGLSVLFLAAGSEEDFTLSGRFRVFNYLPYLRRNGVRARVIVWNTPLKTLGENIDRIRTHRLLRTDTPGKIWKLLTLILLAPFFDVVFIQRTRLPVRVLRVLRRTAKRLVYDYDDALFEACPYLGVPEWSGENAAAIRERFIRMLPVYDHVIAGNEHLAAFVHAHGVASTVVPTPVDTRTYAIRTPAPHAGLAVIGWVGAGEQHLPHLRLLLRPLVRLRERYKFVFRIIGVMGSPAFREVFDPELSGQVEYIDSIPQERLVAALQDFAAGVMPLVDDPWSRGKCGYKALLTMALGVPTVASPVGVNRDIIRHRQNGFLASNEEEWYDSLAYILTHPEEMAALGRRGRGAVEENYSQDVCERRLLETLMLVSGKPSRSSPSGPVGRKGALER